MAIRFCQQRPAQIVAAKAETTAQVTTNSAALTVPTTKRGGAPAPIRLEVTTGPQPPPPMASRKPPTVPSGAMNSPDTVLLHGTSGRAR